MVPNTTLIQILTTFMFFNTYSKTLATVECKLFKHFDDNMCDRNEEW